MPELNEIEKKFLKIMGIEVHGWGFHDTEEKGSILKDPEKNEYDGEFIKIYKYTETYHGSKCDVSFIAKGDRDINGNDKNKKKAVEVVRGELKYTLEYDESEKKWTVYVIDSWHSDYSRYAEGITAKMIWGDFCINISDSMDGPIEIRIDRDTIYCKSRYEGTKKIIFTPSNFEEILRSSIKKIYTTGEAKEKKSEAFAKFIPLFCGEILQGVLYQKVCDISNDPTKELKNRSKEIDELHDIQTRFLEYGKMKSRNLTEIELEFLNSMGIESDGYDYGFDCNVLFDSGTCETLRFFGTRNVKDGSAVKRISAHMLNGTTVNLVEEVLDEHVENYYYESKPEKEIRILRNYMEYILQLHYEKCCKGVTLYIQDFDCEEKSNLYYLDHKYASYRVNRFDSPWIKVACLDNGMIRVIIHGAKGFNNSYIHVDERNIYDGDNTIPFTVEKLQGCLAAKIQDMPNEKIRDEFMYQLPFLSVFIPMFLLKDTTNRYATCCCNHESGECEGCKDDIEDAGKLEKSTLILAQFDSYMISQAEDKKSGARQKNIGEVSSQN